MAWKTAKYVAPPIEGVHLIYFKDEVSRYHVAENCAVTSWGMNLMLGRNPKIVARAIKQLFTASDEEQHQAAVELLHRCMILRFELELNRNWNTVGTQATPYLQALHSAYYNGAIPERKYVPKEVFASMAGGRWRLHKPDHHPPNYEEYILPQSENVAERYSFRDADRDLWTLTDPQITGGDEVPFFYSEDSAVAVWNWWELFNWLCERMQRLQEDCDITRKKPTRTIQNRDGRGTLNDSAWRFYTSIFTSLLVTATTVGQEMGLGRSMRLA